MILGEAMGICIPSAHGLPARSYLLEYMKPPHGTAILPATHKSHNDILVLYASS
jgi:hypothetical protein